MNHQNSLNAQADSLIEILVAQCADLEQLLSLARAENSLAQASDFEGLLKIVNARTTIGERLEIYHRQIADLRARIGESADLTKRSASAERISELAQEILKQDAQTRLQLAGSKVELAANLTRLQRAQQRAGTYARDNQCTSVAYDRIA